MKSDATPDIYYSVYHFNSFSIDALVFICIVFSWIKIEVILGISSELFELICVVNKLYNFGVRSDRCAHDIS